MKQWLGGSKQARCAESVDPDANPSCLPGRLQNKGRLQDHENQSNTIYIERMRGWFQFSALYLTLFGFSCAIESRALRVPREPFPYDHSEASSCRCIFLLNTLLYLHIRVKKNIPEFFWSLNRVSSAQANFIMSAARMPLHRASFFHQKDRITWVTYENFAVHWSYCLVVPCFSYSIAFSIPCTCGFVIYPDSDHAEKHLGEMEGQGNVL